MPTYQLLDPSEAATCPAAFAGSRKEQEKRKHRLRRKRNLATRRLRRTLLLQTTGRDIEITNMSLPIINRARDKVISSDRINEICCKDLASHACKFTNRIACTSPCVMPTRASPAELMNLHCANKTCMTRFTAEPPRTRSARPPRGCKLIDEEVGQRSNDCDRPGADDIGKL